MRKQLTAHYPTVPRLSWIAIWSRMVPAADSFLERAFCDPADGNARGWGSCLGLLFGDDGDGGTPRRRPHQTLRQISNVALRRDDILAGRAVGSTCATLCHFQCQDQERNLVSWLTPCDIQVLPVGPCAKTIDMTSRLAVSELDHHVRAYRTLTLPHLRPRDHETLRLAEVQLLVTFAVAGVRVGRRHHHRRSLRRLHCACRQMSILDQIIVEILMRVYLSCTSAVDQASQTVSRPGDVRPRSRIIRIVNIRVIDRCSQYLSSLRTQSKCGCRPGCTCDEAGKLCRID